MHALDALKTLEAGPAGQIYTGVGSRKTPRSVGLAMCALGVQLASLGHVLRSGAADGADLAFESGADFVVGARKEIFLPYRSFNQSQAEFIALSPGCFELAAQVHPAWERCSAFARKAHARNAMQLLGRDLSQPTSLLVCWTPDGAVDTATSINAGGTRTAIAIAQLHGVPVLNLARPDHLAALQSVLSDMAVELAHSCLRMKGDDPRVAPVVPAFDAGADAETKRGQSQHRSPAL